MMLLHQVNLKEAHLEAECPAEWVEWAACPAEWVEWAACPAWIWINFHFHLFLFNKCVFSLNYISMEKNNDKLLNTKIKMHIFLVFLKKISEFIIMLRIYRVSFQTIFF